VTTGAIRRRPAAVGIELESLAREAGLHPEVVRRLVAIGFLGPDGAFPRDAAARLARAVRLRRDLGLNYAGALLACELLDKIERLERQLGAQEMSRPAAEVTRTWIRTS
jgi:chaperone modulatory protein CbpM